MTAPHRGECPKGAKPSHIQMCAWSSQPEALSMSYRAINCGFACPALTSISGADEETEPETNVKTDASDQPIRSQANSSRYRKGEHISVTVHH